MKKTTLSLLLLALILPGVPAAELYRWTDEKGVIHITDDLSSVPAKYREQDRVRKEDAEPPQPEAETALPARPVPETGKRELYGDRPLEWWGAEFKKLKDYISEAGEKLEDAKKFVSDFEGGKKYYTIYSREKVSQYEAYRAEIPVLEESLKKLKEEFEEFRRKAKNAGVPRDIRE